MSETMRYFDLTKPAPARLAMLRAAFAGHADKYPHCPEQAKPKSWRDIRRATYTDVSAYCGALSQGFNGTDNYKTPIWHAHTGEQFRHERFCDDVARIGHNGWFTDTEGREKARGIVGSLPHNRYIAGYHWSSNDERVYFPEVYDDETEAARAADSHAESFAESAREDSERFDATQDAERETEEKERAFKLAFRARHVSADHAELARDALEELRIARDVLARAAADYERGLIMCADGYVNENSPVSECPECGAALDGDGAPIGEHCNHCPDPCPSCGNAPCTQYC